MIRRCVVALLLTAAVSGCAVKQVKKDQDQIRVALLDLYTDQIIDNLIRASNGLPIIQLDYSNAAGTLTCRQTATFGESQAVTDSGVLALPAAALTTTRTILTTINAGFVADRTNQVAITASPVIASNEVYDAYLDYLSVPGSLLVGCDPPPPGAAHIARKWGDKYYWVPIEFQRQFFKLSLATTAQRGKALFAPDVFFSVMIEDANEVPDDPPADSQASDATDKLGEMKSSSETAGTESGTAELPLPAATATTGTLGAVGPTLQPPPGADASARAAGTNGEASGNSSPGASEAGTKLPNMLVDVKLNKKIPNDAGRIAVSIDKTEVTYTVLIGRPTDRDVDTIRIIFDPNIGPKTVEEFRSKLPLAAKIYLQYHQPKPPTIDDRLDRINFQLQQIQFNQQRSPFF